MRVQRGTVCAGADRHAGALEEFNRARAQNPQDAEALYWRTEVEYDLGRDATGDARAAYFSQAFRDIALAAELDPASEKFQQRLTFYRKNIPEVAPPAAE